MGKWDTQQLNNYLTLPRGAKAELAFKFKSPPSQVSTPYKRCCCSCSSFPLSLHREQTHIPYSRISKGFSPGWGIPAPVNPNMNSHPWVKHFAWGDVGQIFISRKCNYKPELLWGAVKEQTNISSLEHLPKAQEHIPATWNPCLQSSVTQSLVPAGPKEARKEKSLRGIGICVRCKVQGDSVPTTNKYLQPDCLLWKQEGYFPLSAVPGW